MTAPRWEREESWWRYVSPQGWEYVVERDAAGSYVGMYYACDASEEKLLGPWRKTRAAALNDCRRHAKGLRAGLVVFGRAKLP